MGTDDIGSRRLLRRLLDRHRAGEEKQGGEGEDGDERYRCACRVLRHG
jgi:hypothetical protein